MREDKKCKNCGYASGTKRTCNNKNSDEYTDYVDGEASCKGWCSKDNAQK